MSYMVFNEQIILEKLNNLMALDMEVGLGPVHIVLDRDPAPLPKKGA